MQDVAQLVRALVCGAGGRGFEPHLPAKSLVEQTGLFCCYDCIVNLTIWRILENYDLSTLILYMTKFNCNPVPIIYNEFI